MSALFSVTIDSSVKSRQRQQTESTSPGSLRYGVIICYNKIYRQITGQCSAYHKMVVLDCVWATDPSNPSTVRNSEEAVKMVKIWVALLNGPWLKSLIDNVGKLALFIKFYKCSFHKIKTKLSKYCHMLLKMQPRQISG